MKKFLLSNFTIGLLLSLITLSAFFLQINFFESLELKTYDLRAMMRQSSFPVGEIAIIAIDDDSISKLGRWPWPRSVIGEGISAASKAGAKVIGLNILFSEQEKNQGLAEIRNLKEIVPGLFQNEIQANVKSKYYSSILSKLKTERESIKEQITAALTEAEIRLDNDTKFVSALEQNSNIILPMFFALGPSLGKEDEFLSSNIITQIENPEDIVRFSAVEGYGPTLPLSIFAAKSAAVGHVNILSDNDGVVRSEIPFIQFQGDFVPSFAFQIVRQFLNIPIEEVKLTLGDSISAGRLKIPIDENGKMLINFNGPFGTFPYYSFFDVINNKIDPEALSGKIVLIGHIATGIADLNVTPLGHNFPGVELTANSIENMIHQNFITRPIWAFKIELIAIFIIGLFISLILPRLKAFLGALFSFTLLAGIIGAGTYLFVTSGYWLKIFYPVFLLITGYVIITSKRFFRTEKNKELVEASAIETNKMLGLSFQGQGMLDMAFEKFRKCPVNDQLKELLYNLALDFERKRQFNKAVAAYEYIMISDPKYKKIDERINQLKAASDGAVFGMGVNKGAAEGTVILEGASAAKPTLGRYEIIKELGRGAMGTVYLGRDPKINRQVAIKTVRFDDKVDESMINSVKERFFREAESAGNLSHPNIIKIYDAGEDNEVSYIAMELLDGEDFKIFTAKDKLLPLPTVLDYTAKIADALDCAHQQGIIHRDIKPANIMFLKDGTLRVTDFGIARIASSTKTQTGTVLGTPSYMSPEQLSGKKVDGRSDIFSLGVLFFELLTGTKPFDGTSIAELLYKIANEKHPDPRAINPSIPETVTGIVDKMLEKDAEKRYSRGSDVADDIKNLLNKLKETKD